MVCFKQDVFEPWNELLKQDNHMISFFQVDASGLLQYSSGMYEYAFI